MKDEFDMSQFKDEFIKEVSDTLEAMEKELLELEKHPEDMELLNSIFRDAHTIKGSAAFLNFKYMKELTHKMENILDELRTGKIKANTEIIDILFKSSDCLKQMVNNIIEGKSDKLDIAGIISEIVNISNKKIEKISEKINEIEKTAVEVRNETKQEAKQEKFKEELKVETTEPVEIETELKKDEIQIKGINSIRVDTKRIDAIMNMVSELVTGRNRLCR